MGLGFLPSTLDANSAPRASVVAMREGIKEPEKL